MSDHEFEKQVRQNLQELRMTPSVESWENIENELRQTRRRRAPFLWLPLLLVGMAAGGFFFFNAQNNDAVKNSFVKKESESAAKKEDNSQKQIVAKKSDRTQNQNIEVNSTPSKSVSALKVNTHPNSQKNESTVTAAEKNKKENNRKVSALRSITPAQERDMPLVPEIQIKQTHPLPLQAATQQLSYYSKFPTPAADAFDKPSASIRMNSNKNVLPQTNVSTINPFRNKTKKWSFGVTAFAGISAVNEGDFFNLSLNKAMVEDVAYRAPAVGSFAPSYTPSRLTPGFSYSVGATVKRELSKKLSISASVNYLQLNTKNKVGEKVYGSQIVNNGTRGYLSVSNYYTLEVDRAKDYNNRYHFIEIPVTLNTRINKSQKLPLYFDAGVSFARLLSSNSLHFDGTTGVYYKNDELLNQNQVSVATGFNVKLFNKTSYSLLIGPAMRYNLTKMLQKDVSANKSLMTLGLDMKLFLR